MTIADRIKQKREEKHLSQEDLAKICGYADKTSISKIENSGDNVTLKKIKRIADALGVTHRYLMGWEESPTTISGHDSSVTYVGFEENPDPEVQKAIELYNRYKNLTPANQAAFLTLLDSLQSDS